MRYHRAIEQVARPRPRPHLHAAPARRLTRRRRRCTTGSRATPTTARRATRSLARARGAARPAASSPAAAAPRSSPRRFFFPAEPAAPCPPSLARRPRPQSPQLPCTVPEACEQRTPTPPSRDARREAAPSGHPRSAPPSRNPTRISTARQAAAQVRCPSSPPSPRPRRMLRGGDGSQPRPGRADPARRRAPAAPSPLRALNRPCFSGDRRLLPPRPRSSRWGARAPADRSAAPGQSAADDAPEAGGEAPRGQAGGAWLRGDAHSHDVPRPEGALPVVGFDDSSGVPRAAEWCACCRVAPGPGASTRGAPRPGASTRARAAAAERAARLPTGPMVGDISRLASDTGNEGAAGRRSPQERASSARSGSSVHGPAAEGAEPRRFADAEQRQKISLEGSDDETVRAPRPPRASTRDACFPARPVRAPSRRP
jgi:hypothetical protein